MTPHLNKIQTRDWGMLDALVCSIHDDMRPMRWILRAALWSLLVTGPLQVWADEVEPPVVPVVTPETITTPEGKKDVNEVVIRVQWLRRSEPSVTSTDLDPSVRLDSDGDGDGEIRFPAAQ